MNRKEPKYALSFVPALLGVVAAVLLHSIAAKAPPEHFYPLPQPFDLEELVERAEVIVSAELTASNGVLMFAGYDSNGNPIIPATPTASPGAATPLPYAALPAYDYPVNVVTTYLDDGVIVGGEGFDLRWIGALNTYEDPTANEFLYFLRSNSDGTYGTFGRSCEILDLSESDVLCADTGEEWDGAGGLSSSQFIPALQTEIAIQNPSPTPTP